MSSHAQRKPWLDHRNRGVTAALLAACLLFVCFTSARDTPIDRGAAYLPLETNGIFALRFIGFQNPQSLLSYFPVMDAVDIISEQIKNEASPPANASEAAVRFVFDSDFLPTINALVLGVTIDPETLESPEYIILTGNFSSEEALGKDTLLELSDVPDSPLKTFQNTANRSFYIASPEDGILLISDNKSWVESATNQSAPVLKSGHFFQEAKEFLGNNSDFFLIMNPSILQNLAQEQPMVAMMIGPLLQSEGFTLDLEPGDPPRLSVRALYPDRSQAEVGRKFFDHSIKLIQRRIQQFISEDNLPEDEEFAAQVTRSAKWARSLQTFQNGRTAIMSLPIEHIADRERFRRQVIENLKAQGGFDWSSMSKNLQSIDMEGE